MNGNTAAPRGMLMTGAIGSIFFALNWALGITMSSTLSGAMMGGGGASSDLVGGLGLLMIVLMFAGGIMQGIGFFGLNKLFKGANIGAGIFAILIPVSFVLIIVASVLFANAAMEGGGGLGMPVMLVAAIVILAVSIGLTGVLGGISFLGNGGGFGKIAGIAFIAGGGAIIGMMVLGLLKVNIGLSMVNILSYVIVFGLLIGNVGATVVMLGARNK